LSSLKLNEPSGRRRVHPEGLNQSIDSFEILSKSFLLNEFLSVALSKEHEEEIRQSIAGSVISSPLNRAEKTLQKGFFYKNTRLRNTMNQMMIDG